MFQTFPLRYMEIIRIQYVAVWYHHGIGWDKSHISIQKPDTCRSTQHGVETKTDKNNVFSAQYAKSLHGCLYILMQVLCMYQTPKLQ
jgi:hypothetical protein